MKIKEPLCFACQHLKLYPNCEAYPNGIPQEIRDGDVSHLEEFNGDNGITFTLIQHPQDVELTLLKKKVEKMRREKANEDKNG